MLAMEVEYLMGRVLASQYNDRRAVEWPPHPARLFAALVAAYEECELDNEAKQALEWLEALPEPSIYANPPENEGWVRDVYNIFVPANDNNEQFKKKNDGKKSIFPKIVEGINIARSRSERWFPAFTPYDRHVWFIWKETDNEDKFIPALQLIAERITYLGHSMSPVRVFIDNDPPAPTLTPSMEGELMLRVTGKGRLHYLETLYELRKQNETIQPRLGKVARYKVKGEQPIITFASLFQRSYIFRRISGIGLPLEWSYTLVNIVRRALLKRVNDIHQYEVISGHDASGQPTKKPHLAIIPLPDAGHRYADGHIMGFALLLPDDIDPQSLEAFEDAIYDFSELKLGRYGEWKIERINADQTQVPKALRLTTYTQKSAIWASVTPVIFGHHPKKSQVGPGKNGGKVFAELCKMIGLPEPAEARIGPISIFSGVPKASEFERPGKSQINGKLSAHVWLRFAEPVRGPVLIGAGRFLGFGLCRPVPNRNSA